MNKFYDLPTDHRLASKIITENAKTEFHKAQLGVLGRFFGSSENVRLYIVGLIAVVILFIALVYTLMPSNWRSDTFGIKEMWTIITPIITTIVGYLIGSKETKKDEP